MDDGSPLWRLVLIGIFVLVHGMLYGFGTAVQELNEQEIEKKAEEGEKRGKELLAVLESPRRYICALHVWTSLIAVALGTFVVPWAGSSLTRRFYREGGFLTEQEYLVLMLCLMALAFAAGLVAVCILIPKKLAYAYPEKWAEALLPAARFFMLIGRPFTWVIGGVSNAVVRIFGVDPSKEEDDVTEEEIISMVNEGHEQGVLESSTAEMITNIFQMNDKNAQDIMTHRKNIHAIEQSTGLSAALEYMLEKNNSRYPVYDEEIDNITGILYLRDAANVLHSHPDRRDTPVSKIPGLIREAAFVPETKHIDELFHKMQMAKIHMVIVVDEYGQTAGVVAMEDILEEIVGNIFDEYDIEEVHIRKNRDGSLRMEGLTPLEEAAKVLQLEFEDVEFETLNGLLISLLERIPGEEERPAVEYEGYRFQVLSVRNNIISSVKVTKLPVETEETKEAE
jgi:putative hemolysin